MDKFIKSQPWINCFVQSKMQQLKALVHKPICFTKLSYLPGEGKVEKITRQFQSRSSFTFVAKAWSLVYVSMCTSEINRLFVQRVKCNLERETTL